MKALLLCGGDGTRLRPFTYTKPKTLLPLGNKPILFHIMEALGKASIKELVLILGQNGKAVEELLTKENPWGFTIKYLYQPEPLGLAHAVLLAKEALGQGPFLMYLGDNILGEPLQPLLEKFQREKPDGLVLLRRVNNPKNFGVAIIDKDKVIKVEEKPEIPRSNLALVGVYLFSEEIHQSVRNIQPSWRGELEITDAIQDLIDRKKTVSYQHFSGWWKDTGNAAQLLEANKYILRKIAPSHAGEIKKTQITGALELKKNSILKNSQVKGPVSIGADCRISGSILGPYLSIGDGVEIVNCRLNQSIVLSDGELRELSLTKSIVGERVKINGGKPGLTPSSLLIGADSLIKM